MIEQSAIQQYLTDNFHRAKARNSAYSVRSFARKLGMSSGAVSAILRGQRRVSRKMAEKMLISLDADPKTRVGILTLFPVRQLEVAPLARTQMQLNIDQFQLVSKSVHYEVLCLMETESFREDTLWIAGRLHHSAREVQDAMERLIRLGMIKRNSRGKLVLTGDVYQSPDGIPDSSIRQSHYESNDQARRALEINAVEERDFSSETMAIDPELLPAARRILRDCRRKIAALFAEGNTQEVYKLSLQLFPLSRLSAPVEKGTPR